MPSFVSWEWPASESLVRPEPPRPFRIAMRATVAGSVAAFIATVALTPLAGWVWLASLAALAGLFVARLALLARDDDLSG